MSIKEKSLKLYEALVSGEGINHIIEEASKILNNPVTLSDSSYRLIAFSNNTQVDDPIWNDLISLGYSSYDIVKKFNNEHIIEQISNHNKPVIIDTGIGSEIGRILGKVVVSGKIVAHIGVFAVNHDLTKADVELADILCSILACELEKDPCISNLTGSLQENLMIDLLNGNVNNKHQLQGQLKNACWVPKKNFYILYISLENNSTANPKVNYIRAHLERLNPNFKTIFFNESIVFLINFDKDEYIENLWPEISNLLSDYNLSAGISFQFSELISLNTFYNQAKKSYSIGKDINPEDIMYLFDDYYFFYLLDYLDQQIELDIYCHKGVLKLFQFDKKHNTKYYNTLYKYINNQFNLTETAKKLYIHKNTMLHRRDRIQEISGIDFSDDIDLFEIYLTFKIIDFNEKRY